MSVTSVSSTTDLSTYTSSATGGTTLNQEDFLTILVAQLENQDPLDPQDSAEFIAQMAQFSTLEQQIQTNENLETLIASAGNTESYAAFQLLGTEIVAESDSFSLAGDSVELGFTLEEGAEEVQIAIYDADQCLVATLQLGDTEIGTSFVSWDGSGDDGSQLTSGDYSFSVSAVDDGTEVGATSLVRAGVTQVSLESSGSVLKTDAGEFRLADVASVSKG